METFLLLLKIASMFMSRWFELDKEKREKKKAVMGEIKNASTIKDKKQRASRLNTIVNRANRL